MPDNPLPSPLLFYARSGSYLRDFIQASGGNPNNITVEDVGQLIVKYVLEKRLCDTSNPSVVWANIHLTNVLQGFHAYHSSQLKDMLRWGTFEFFSFLTF